MVLYKASTLTVGTGYSNGLEQKGFEVIRFWNNELLRETETVLNEILEKLEAKNSADIPL